MVAEKKKNSKKIAKQPKISKKENKNFRNMVTNPNEDEIKNSESFYHQNETFDSSNQIQQSNNEDSQLRSSSNNNPYKNVRNYTIGSRIGMPPIRGPESYQSFQQSHELYNNNYMHPSHISQHQGSDNLMYNNYRNMNQMGYYGMHQYPTNNSYSPQHNIMLNNHGVDTHPSNNEQNFPESVNGKFTHMGQPPIFSNTYQNNMKDSSYLHNHLNNTPAEQLNGPNTPIKPKASPRVKTGRKKISLEYISKKSKRSVTFSKRKKGLMKKTYEICVLTGAEALVLLANENGHVYTYSTPRFKPILENRKGIIKSCLFDNDPLNFGESEDENYEIDEQNSPMGLDNSETTKLSDLDDDSKYEDE